jgi:NADH pyrophosphatase NudC (nudix superfamily)
LTSESNRKSKKQFDRILKQIDKLSNSKICIEVKKFVYRKNSHCSYCGHPFLKTKPWPRDCANCGNTSYLNPLPVSVVLVPVDNGLLFIRRRIEPGKGKLALPGGFINLGETWQEAGVREGTSGTSINKLLD